MSRRPIVLLTNDDGIRAEGLERLAEAMEAVGEVWIAAPDRERSASSHSLSLRLPIRVEWHADRRLTVDGTPADAVLLAVRRLMPELPDVVVSGINHGPNLGDDVNYSGTVGAAMEATILGIPAFAVSLADREGRDFGVAATFAGAMARRVYECGLPGGCMLNVNVPSIPRSQIRGVKVARLGRRTYRDMINDHPDGPAGGRFWIGDGHAVCEVSDDTDCRAVEEGWIAVTPLRLDMTHHDLLDLFRGWNLELPKPDRAAEGDEAKR